MYLLTQSLNKEIKMEFSFYPYISKIKLLKSPLYRCFMSLESKEILNSPKVIKKIQILAHETLYKRLYMHKKQLPSKKKTIEL